MFTSTFAQTYFFSALLILFFGSLGSLCARKHDSFANWWGNLCAIFASLCGLAASLIVILRDGGFSFALGSSLPLLSYSFRVDALSAFFIFVISLIVLPVSVYALGYVKHFYGSYSISSLGFFYNIFIAGLFMVVSAHNVLFFLVVWEIMSLSSYFLVIFMTKLNEKKENGL